MFERGVRLGKFEVVDTFPVPDYRSEAVHLRHVLTGLEVVHLRNDDEENLFTFAFRTPNPSGDGAAHVLEHSVLCGSERFPMKDPFVALSNQSVKTYLNALTYPDRTVYPASSTVRADYFNLMRVYGDAVFFPRLDPEVFMQEAHRLELGADGSPSIQGVVYNEMKGDYSSFESAVSAACDRSLLAGSVYETDSGGDPLEIPSLTHGRLRDFHARWYRPDNCLVFLYGDIPTEEQLEFLQSELLDRLEARLPAADVSEEARRARLGEFLSFVTPRPVSSPVFLRAEGPSGGEDGEAEDGNTVVLNWSFGERSDSEAEAERAVVAGILMNHDGSPLQKALLDSGLGEDIAPQTGVSSYLRHSMMSLGLRGVKEGDERKVERVVMDALERLVREGIDRDDVESALLSMEFSQRSIRRLGGPYSKTLMGRVVAGWLYGLPLSRQIRSRSVIEGIRRKIVGDAGCLPRLVRSLLIDNPARSLVVVSPSDGFSEGRRRAESEIVARMMARTDADSVRAENARLRAFQEKADDPSVIPHLNPRDFVVDGRPVMPRVRTEVGEAAEGIPLFTNREVTNGIVYVGVGFPVDSLSPSDYPLVPLLSDAAPEMGFRRADGTAVGWAEAARLVALHAGDFGCASITTEACPTERGRELAASSRWVGRDWLVFRAACLEEQLGPTLDLLADFIAGADFSDSRRLRDVVSECRNDMDANVIPDGHRFAEMRAKCASCRSSAVDELWNGISQMLTLHAAADGSMEELSGRLSRMLGEVRSAGAFVHVVAEDSALERLGGLLGSFAVRARLRPLSERPEADFSALAALTRLPGQERADSDEVCATSAQVGFAAEYFAADPLGTEIGAAESVCAHWLSNNLLWERIRTVGGAYGAFASSDSIPGAFSLATYRDPSPFASLGAFGDCLSEAASAELSEEEAERAVVGNYSQWVQPQTPRSRGASALLRLLSGLSDEDREGRLLASLGVGARSLAGGFSRLAELSRAAGDSVPFRRKRVVICGRGQLSAGVPDGFVRVELPI